MKTKTCTTGIKPGYCKPQPWEEGSLSNKGSGALFEAQQQLALLQ